jgi:hypothetical protein
MNSKKTPPFHNFTTPLPSLLIIFFLLPMEISERVFFFFFLFKVGEGKIEGSYKSTNEIDKEILVIVGN